LKIVLLSAELRGTESFSRLRRAWPELVFHDRISNEYWGRLYDERADFQFALVEEGRVLAEGSGTAASTASRTSGCATRVAPD
jgi:hypothetical protein